MIWVPRPSADRMGVEGALRRAYPGGLLDEPELEALDQDLPGERLAALLETVAAIPRLNAVMEVEVVRSHILHIGSEDAPDWEQLNRELTDGERNAAVSARPDG